jgi:GTPase SAR1 family protein
VAGERGVFQPCPYAISSRPPHHMPASSACRYRAISRSFFRNSAAAVIVFDVTSRRSLDSVEYWRDAFVAECPEAAIVLVGNKSDLSEKREISTDEGRARLARMAGSGLRTFVETSAKTGKGVSRAFQSAAQLIVNRTQNVAFPVPPPDSS